MAGYRQKQYGLMDSVGGAVQGTVNAARGAVGGTISGVGSVLDSGGGKTVGGLAGAAGALGTWGLPAAGIGASAGAAAGAGLGLTLGSVVPFIGNAVGAGVGAVAGGALGATGAAGTVAKAGQVIGSKLTQATGEGLKGIGNAIKPGQAAFSEYGPGVDDAAQVGLTVGTTGLLGKGLSGVARFKSVSGDFLLGAPDMAVDKAKEIIGDSVREGETYQPTVKNAYVTFSEVDQNFQDMADTVQEGVVGAGKTLGNTAAGATGGLLGGAVGAGVGAVVGKAAVSASNKFLGTAMKGGGKYGALAGMIGGSILGAQKGSSLFSARRTGSVLGERSFAVGSELAKAGKGLWNVAKAHSGTIGEGLAAGALMAGTGYGAKKLVDKDKENGGTGTGALGKIALGAGGLLLGGALLKKGANYKMLGNTAFKNRGLIDRGVGALNIGVGFGAGMAALPLVQQKLQEDAVKRASGEKTSNTGSVLMKGAGIAAASVLGYKVAKSGLLGNTLQKGAASISKGIEAGKVKALKSLGASDKALEARKVAKEASSVITPPKYVDPSFDKGEYFHTVLDKVSAGAGAGTQKTQELASQLVQQDSKYLKSAGKFMQNHKKTALVAAAPLGFAAGMGSWNLGEDLTNRAIKSVDPNYKTDENENV